MPSIKTKVGISVISAGTLGGMGYGIDALINTDSLENYLQNNELSLIEDDDTDEEWSEIFESYKLEKAGFEIGKEIDSPDKIKQWCKENLKKNIKSTSDPLFQKASRWCVEITTIEEGWGGEGVFEENVTELTHKYNELDPKIRKLVDEEIVAGADTNEKGAKIKKWCDTNKKRRHVLNNEKDFYFSNIGKVCLKVSGDSSINPGSSVRGYLTSKGLQITPHDSESEWDKAFETYKIEATTSELKIKEEELKDKKELIEWCGNTLVEKINSEADEKYKKASHWCVKYETINEKLSKSGKKDIDSVENLNTKYSTLPQDLQNQINLISVGSTAGTNQNGQKFVKWCEENRKRRSNNSNSSLLTQISEHCFAKN